MSGDPVWNFTALPIVADAPGDTVIADFAAADALWSYEVTLFPPSVDVTLWDRTVLGLGGNETIIRDRMGDYKGEGESFFADGRVFIQGGAGVDSLIYTYQGGIDATLAMDGSFYDTHTGIIATGSVEAYGPVPAGVALFGIDYLNGVENLFGTAFDDRLTGNFQANTLHGLQGNDEIDGGAGDDLLVGGAGDDTINGGFGDDTIEGGDGNDTIEGFNGDDDIDGGAGDDEISGGAGDDDITGGTGDDTIFGHQGEDTINGGFGEDSIDGGTDDDVLYGGRHNDILIGGQGNDELHGGQHNDALYGGEDDDALFGDLGNDVLAGGEGSNLLHGGSGTDTASFQDVSGVTVFAVVDGSMSAFKASGTDTLLSIENLVLSDASDVVFHTGSGGIIEGRGGDDLIFGYGGADTVYGGAGDDYVDGGADDDLVFGGGGGDTVVGGEGDDMLIGGADADTFRWNDGDSGFDTVGDFLIGEDKVAFGEGYLADPPGPGEGYAGSVFAFLADDASASTLVANTASDGWTTVAKFEGVTIAELAAAIASGELFDPVEVGPVGGGAPGGYVPPARGEPAPSIGLATVEQAGMDHGDARLSSPSEDGTHFDYIIGALSAHAEEDVLSGLGGLAGDGGADPDPAAIGVSLQFHFGQPASPARHADEPLIEDLFGGDMFGDALLFA